MFVPGAEISGLNTPSGVGPWEEKSAIRWLGLYFLEKETLSGAPLSSRDLSSFPSSSIINTAGFNSTPGCLSRPSAMVIKGPGAQL